MPPGQPFSLAAILLAAGQSSRMGRPKLLLPWGKTTVLGHLIQMWAQLPATQIAVVCAAGDVGIADELNRLRFPAANWILNPDASRGMFSSIQCAAQWQGWDVSLTHWALALGDQPHLQAATLSAVADLASQNPGSICQPAFAGHGRHPVLLPKSIFKELAGTKAKTLKEFLESKSSAVKTIEVNDPGLALDIDSPSDYEAALRLVG